MELFHSFRGSKSYRLETSPGNGVAFSLVASGTFPDLGTPSLSPHPLVNHDVGPVCARFVKYVCTAYYADGCALEYIGVNQPT